MIPYAISYRKELTYLFEIAWAMASEMSQNCMFISWIFFMKYLTAPICIGQNYNLSLQTNYSQRSNPIT